MQAKKDRELNTAFTRRLKRCVVLWRQGATLLLLLQIVRWALLSLLFYLMADYLLALSEGVRQGINLLLPLGWVAAAVPRLWQIWRRSYRSIAREIDRLGQHRRHEVLTAWELLGSVAGKESSGMKGFLIERSVAQALKRLDEFPKQRILPLLRMLRQVQLLGLQLAASGILLLCLGVVVVTTVVPRIVWPRRDIPPYSRLRFQVTPEQPVILYGDSVELAVTVSGAPIRDQVRLLTRLGSGRPQSVICFQEGGGKFGQRLESVTQPLQFCFAAGRARSRWHSVVLQLQPQIEAAEVVLTPPEYTGLPVINFAAGADDVAGVWGTTAKLTLKSNRPLSRGELELRQHHASGAEERVVTGRVVDGKSVVFEWRLEGDGEARANLYDLRGTATAQPLVLQQRCLPDKPPVIALHEPPAYSLATTSAVVRLHGVVSDDFGLSRIDWLRGMPGYHDRGVTLRQGEIGCDAQITVPLDLGRVGVAPGEKLEFYLEALDNNPRLKGLAASEIVRVEIISDEEYVEMQRTRESVADFIVRYRAADNAVREAMTALAELQRAVEAGKAGEEIQRAVQRAEDAHKRADELFQVLVSEFAIYDEEKLLHEICDSARVALAQNLSELAAMVADESHCSREKVAELAARLQPGAAALQEVRRGAEEVAEVALLMEAAVNFKALVQRQDELVRRLGLRYGQHGKLGDLTHLPPYGAQQAEIERELVQCIAQAADAAAKLPEKHADLKQDTDNFIKALEESEAVKYMGSAVTAARNSDARKCWQEAREALMRLQMLLKAATEGGNNCFGGLCQGTLPGSCSADTAATLQAMFRALSRRHEPGSAGGSGMDAAGGGVGAGESGYSEAAVPIYGPQRAMTARGGAGSGVGAGGEGGAGEGAARARAARIEVQPTPQGYTPAGERVPVERLPERYREAIKRYYHTTQ